MLASDWFSLLLTGKATADNGVAKGHAGSTGNDVTGTGSDGSDVTGTGSDRKCGGHVFWSGKPLTSCKNRSWAQIKKREDISCRGHDVPSG